MHTIPQFKTHPIPQFKTPPIPQFKLILSRRIQAMFSWKSVAFLLVFGGSYVYVIDSFQREKKRKVAESQNKVIGQAALGGEWELTRLDGTKGGSEDLRGNFGLLYFGFTHCPGKSLSLLFPAYVAGFLLSLEKVRISVTA